MFFFLLFRADFPASAASSASMPSPHDPWRRDQQNPALDQKVTYQKNHVTHTHKKHAIMVADVVAAVLVFDWALSIAPLSIGVVWYHRGKSLSRAFHVEVGFDLDGFLTVWDEGSRLALNKRC